MHLASVLFRHHRYEGRSKKVLGLEQNEQSVCQKGVENANNQNCTQVSEELLERYWRDPAKIYFTSRYSGWNVDQPVRFWVRTTKHAIERTILSKLSFHYIPWFRFYRAMLRRARYCYGKLSVCPSVRNIEVLWLHRLEIFKNNFMVS